MNVIRKRMFICSFHPFIHVEPCIAKVKKHYNLSQTPSLCVETQPRNVLSLFLSEVRKLHLTASQFKFIVLEGLQSGVNVLSGQSDCDVLCQLHTGGTSRTDIFNPAHTRKQDKAMNNFIKKMTDMGKLNRCHDVSLYWLIPKFKYPN